MPDKTTTLDKMLGDLKDYINRRGDDYQAKVECTDEEKDQYMVGLFAGLFVRMKDEPAKVEKDEEK